LVQGFLGVQRRSVEAVGTAAVADPHRPGHLGGPGLGEEVQHRHAEGDHLGGLQHFGTG
jgi:hypothetical protein